MYKETGAITSGRRRRRIQEPKALKLFVGGTVIYLYLLYEGGVCAFFEDGEDGPFVFY